MLLEMDSLCFLSLTLPSVAGVLQAVQNVVQVLGPALQQSGTEPWDQRAIDQLLCKVDGSEQKDHLGANAILGLSMACARAGAAAKVRKHFVTIHSCPESRN